MQRKLKLTGVIFFFAVTLIITVIASRWVTSLSDAAKLEAFQDRVASLGAGGWMLLFLIQYVQIVVAFIPGGPIQMIAGALFGVWGGLALCITGTLLATATVFYLVSRYGRPVISLFVEEKDIAEYRHITGSKNLEKLIVLLFLIPGTPKDALTYLFALTGVPMRRFMLLSTLARLPAVLTSLLAGGSIAEGNWLRAVTMFAIMTAAGALGFFAQRVLRGHIKNRSRPEK